MYKQKKKLLYYNYMQELRREEEEYKRNILLYNTYNAFYEACLKRICVSYIPKNFL